MSQIQVSPLDGVGAEVSGVALGADMPQADADVIRNALGSHGVLFFRDQDFDEVGHIALAEKLGQININRFFAAHPSHPEIAMVAKGAEDKHNIGGGWHTDHSYDQEPALGSILVARELPTTGGDTLFASMYAAYDALDDAMKDQLKGLNAIHSAKHIFGSADDTVYSQSDAGKGRIGNASTADILQDVTHPLVIRHPISGKAALYVNPAFTIGIEGMDADESGALLQQLYAHAMKPQFHHRFQWKPGSVAIWDNRATWHFALNDYHGHRRVMHRITLEGEALEAG